MEATALIKRLRRRAEMAGLNVEGSRGGVFGSFGTKATTVEQPTGKPLEIVAWATTTDVDMDGEVLVPEGMDTSTYLGKNRNLFWEHELDLPVATMRSMTLFDGKGWKVRGQLLNLDTDYAKAVRALAEAGTLGMSVGYLLMKGAPPTEMEAKKFPGVEYMLHKTLAVEVSYTAHPANVSCRTTEVREVSEAKSHLAREVLTKGGFRREVMEALHLMPKKRRVVLC